MKFYANPYNIDVTGFYFESIEELEEKSAALKDEFGLKVEEFEVEAMDVTREEMALAEALGINQANIAEFIEFIDTSDEYSWPIIYFLLNYNRASSFDEAIRLANDYAVVESNLLDAATDLFDECYGESIPDLVKPYIDYESFALDCRLGGYMVEFEFGGKTYTCMNASP